MTAAEFYLDTPLYTPIILADLIEFDKITSREDFSDFEGYNPIRRYETTYGLSTRLSSDRHPLSSKSSFNKETSSFIDFKLTCLRSNDVFMFYCYWSGPEMKLMKVGQWPSLADFHISQVKQYDKLLNKQDLREFTKAIGLAANGVGIGSFVYLRRIFENLIYDSVNNMKTAGSFDEVAFLKMRMSERIDYLKDYLPEFLVLHKELYSILSVGIHELTEQDCLQHFDVVKAGIEFILDEKLEKYNREKKMREASEKIKNTASSIKKT